MWDSSISSASKANTTSYYSNNVSSSNLVDGVISSSFVPASRTPTLQSMDTSSHNSKPSAVQEAPNRGSPMVPTVVPAYRGTGSGVGMAHWSPAFMPPQNRYAFPPEMYYMQQQQLPEMYGSPYGLYGAPSMWMPSPYMYDMSQFGFMDTRTGRSTLQMEQMDTSTLEKQAAEHAAQQLNVMYQKEGTQLPTESGAGTSSEVEADALVSEVGGGSNNAIPTDSVIEGVRSSSSPFDGSSGVLSKERHVEGSFAPQSTPVAVNGSIELMDASVGAAFDTEKAVFDAPEGTLLSVAEAKGSGLSAVSSVLDESERVPTVSLYEEEEASLVHMPDAMNKAEKEVRLEDGVPLKQTQEAVPTVDDRTLKYYIEWAENLLASPPSSELQSVKDWASTYYYVLHNRQPTDLEAVQLYIHYFQRKADPSSSYYVNPGLLTEKQSEASAATHTWSGITPSEAAPLNASGVNEGTVPLPQGDIETPLLEEVKSDRLMVQGSGSRVMTQNPIVSLISNLEKHKKSVEAAKQQEGRTLKPTTPSPHSESHLKASDLRKMGVKVFNPFQTPPVATRNTNKAFSVTPLRLNPTHKLERKEGTADFPTGIAEATVSLHKTDETVTAGADEAVLPSDSNPKSVSPSTCAEAPESIEAEALIPNTLEDKKLVEAEGVVESIDLFEAYNDSEGEGSSAVCVEKRNVYEPVMSPTEEAVAITEAIIYVEETPVVLNEEENASSLVPLTESTDLFDRVSVRHNEGTQSAGSASASVYSTASPSSSIYYKKTADKRRKHRKRSSSSTKKSRGKRRASKHSRRKSLKKASKHYYTSDEDEKERSHHSHYNEERSYYKHNHRSSSNSKAYSSRRLEHSYRHRKRVKEELSPKEDIAMDEEMLPIASFSLSDQNEVKRSRTDVVLPKNPFRRDFFNAAASSLLASISSAATNTNAANANANTANAANAANAAANAANAATNTANAATNTANAATNTANAATTNTANAATTNAATTNAATTNAATSLCQINAQGSRISPAVHEKEENDEHSIPSESDTKIALASDQHSRRSQVMEDSTLSSAASSWYATHSLPLATSSPTLMEESKSKPMEHTYITSTVSFPKVLIAALKFDLENYWSLFEHYDLDKIKEFSSSLWPIDCMEFSDASPEIQCKMGVTLFGVPLYMNASGLKDYLISYIRLFFGFDLENLLLCLSKVSNLCTFPSSGVHWHIGCSSLLAKYVLLKVAVIPVLYSEVSYPTPPIVVIRPFKCLYKPSESFVMPLKPQVDKELWECCPREISESEVIETEMKIIQNCLLKNSLALMATVVLFEELQQRGSITCRSVMDMYTKWVKLVNRASNSLCDTPLIETTGAAPIVIGSRTTNGDVLSDGHASDNNSIETLQPSLPCDFVVFPFSQFHTDSTVYINTAKSILQKLIEPIQKFKAPHFKNFIQILN